MSSRSTNDSGREFYKFIVEGGKEFKYVSVLAKGITKCWLCSWVDVKSKIRVNDTSMRLSNIL